MLHLHNESDEEHANDATKDAAQYAYDPCVPGESVAIYHCSKRSSHIRCYLLQQGVGHDAGYACDGVRPVKNGFFDLKRRVERQGAEGAGSGAGTARVDTQVKQMEATREGPKASMYSMPDLQHNA